MYDALQAWRETLAALPVQEAAGLRDGKTALVIVDMVNGFLTEGPLSSPRSASVLPACEDLLRVGLGWGHAPVMFADRHDPDCIEFQSFPPHCIRGTSEAEIARSLREIGSDLNPRRNWDTTAIVIEKNSTNGAITPEFQKWLADNADVTRIVVCGVCTDICVMQFCLTLKTLCNQADRPMEVMVPVNAVETYDALGHNADLCGSVALQLMAQAGITLVKEIVY